MLPRLKAWASLFRTQVLLVGGLGIVRTLLLKPRPTSFPHDCLPFGIAVLSSSSSAAVDVSHEFLHVIKAVVVSHVLVKVLPDPLDLLDPIVIREIGREKVELHLPLPSGQRQLNLAAVMDSKVVEDDVNPSRVLIADGYQPMNEEKGQRAVLAFSFDPSELARSGIEGSAR